ncbi:pseudaminic acid synthase [Akkermansiaceae bacterium]|nr:pseudaminic acid synthase [bacterium]MDA7655071.1 pseudaminic acid synthase [Akkermansiaceae bacterium]MDB4633281.1 pseudaminic acid synthase [Akkermansiaceae bacterium]MDB4801554.1 pseudaminic acid synthase [Akkermansiaceae bacterium]
MKIGERKIGTDHSTYIIAELSANHNGSLDSAIDIIRFAAESGADAIKLQTYTADTLTIDCDEEPFILRGGTIWDGRKLYELYSEAFTPWEWHQDLFDEAKKHGLDCFSTPFDDSAVKFLEQFDPPCYKIASFELTHHPLLKTVAETGRPVIMSTGMASLEEIEEALEVLRGNGSGDIVLLKCTSSYPAPPEEANLARIPDMAERFGVTVGISDHTMDLAVPVAAVTLGATVIEKHFCRSRGEAGPDSSFSLEPSEFREMVEAVRTAEKAIGKVAYARTAAEEKSVACRTSIFVVKPIEAGEKLTRENIRIIRPGQGLAPKYFDAVVGRIAKSDLGRGTPLRWDVISG